uniref:Membrane associated guanylate kinase, WW and PDZ domain containing 2a n=1 Tax=Bursaphelenchus xylophilus TaxID=6326 RepID=A0A1I7S3V7_BURXY
MRRFKRRNHPQPKTNGVIPGHLLSGSVPSLLQHQPIDTSALIRDLVYFPSHINKRTQYERPVKQNGYVETGISPNPAEPLIPPPLRHGHAGTSNDNGWPVLNGNGLHFTCDPAQLKGELITTRLVKGPQGLGFTLVGNDRHSIQNEFIQIKSILPGGPAALDNTLHTGDVLVYVDNELMLGASQDTACRLLRSVVVGEAVTIQVCRGYPLILDHTNKVYDESIYSSTYAQTNFQARNSERIEILIRKSMRGFGFTITDSLQGQRVKSVLFPDQCPNLLEGDLIVEVDGVNVLNMSHVQLVQFLQDLPVGYHTKLLVSRQSPRLSRSRTPTAGFRFGEKTRNTPLPNLAPRSKTPAPSLKRNHYQHSTLQRSYHEDLIDDFAQFRGPLARNGFSSTPDYMPISSLSPMVDSTYKFVTVNLIQQNGGFGFRLVGGVEMGIPLQVGNVIKGGAASQDGRLMEGDEICEIDGKNVVGFRHDIVVALIKQAAVRGHVKILVRRMQRDFYGTLRSNYPSVSNYADPRQFQQSSLVYDVVLNKAEHEDFGCTIVSNVYRFIGKVIPNTPASRSGRLKAGDCVVAINGLSTDEMTHQDVINYVKSCRKSIVFTIDPTKQRSVLLADGSASPSSVLRENIDSPISTANVVQGNGLQYLNGGEKEFEKIPVELKKGSKGFGFSIRGGFEFENMPLFILRIAEDGPAAQEGTLRIGDQLIEINGESTAGMTHHRAISLIREQNVVRLVVSRPQLAA